MAVLNKKPSATKMISGAFLERGKCSNHPFFFFLKVILLLIIAFFFAHWSDLA